MLRAFLRWERTMEQYSDKQWQSEAFIRLLTGALFKLDLGPLALAKKNTKETARGTRNNLRAVVLAHAKKKKEDERTLACAS